MLAERKIRAPVENTLVAGVFPALKPSSAAASWTRHIALRRTPEHLDVVSAVDQLRHEFGRPAAFGKQENLPPRPGDGDIEKAPLLGVWMGLGRCQDQIEQRIVGYLDREPVLPRTHSEDHRIVGLETLAAVNASVSGRASIRSKNPRERTISLTTNASLAFALASPGAFIGVHRCRPGMARVQDREQAPGEAGRLASNTVSAASKLGRCSDRPACSDFASSIAPVAVPFEQTCSSQTPVASTAPGCGRLSRLRQRTIQRRTLRGDRADTQSVNAPRIGPATAKTPSRPFVARRFGQPPMATTVQPMPNHIAIAAMPFKQGHPPPASISKRQLLRTSGTRRMSTRRAPSPDPQSQSPYDP